MVVHELWERLGDWMDIETGLRVFNVAVTRWNVIATTVALVFSIWYGFFVAGSWRTFAILFGGYILGAVWMIMRREQRGD